MEVAVPKPVSTSLFSIIKGFQRARELEVEAGMKVKII